jgi:hypothetical protein
VSLTFGLPRGATTRSLQGRDPVESLARRHERGMHQGSRSEAPRGHRGTQRRPATTLSWYCLWQPLTSSTRTPPITKGCPSRARHRLTDSLRWRYIVVVVDRLAGLCREHMPRLGGATTAASASWQALPRGTPVGDWDQPGPTWPSCSSHPTTNRPNSSSAPVGGGATTAECRRHRGRRRERRRRVGPSDRPGQVDGTPQLPRYIPAVRR